MARSGDEEGSVESLFEYIPLFESGEFASAQSDYLSTGDYPPHVEELLLAMRRAGFDLRGFDWLEWADDARPYLQDPAKIEEADLETIRKLFTMAAHADRFNRSLFPHLCVSGFIQQVLLRLRALSA